MRKWLKWEKTPEHHRQNGLTPNLSLSQVSASHNYRWGEWTEHHFQPHPGFCHKFCVFPQTHDSRVPHVLGFLCYIQSLLSVLFLVPYHKFRYRNSLSVVLEVHSSNLWDKNQEGLIPSMLSVRMRFWYPDSQIKLPKAKQKLFLNMKNPFF